MYSRGGSLPHLVSPFELVVFYPLDLAVPRNELLYAVIPGVASASYRTAPRRIRLVDSKPRQGVSTKGGGGGGGVQNVTWREGETRRSRTARGAA